MRRLVVAALVALLALSVAGCGGGGEEEAAAPPADSAAVPAPPPADTDVNAVPIANRSEAASETFEPFPDTIEIPEAVAERLDRKQAMLLLFYNGAQEQTDDLRSQVDAVIDDNLGLIDLISYDLGKYTSIDSDGIVVVKEEELAEDANAQQAVSLARELGVDHVPYIVIVDDQGYRIFWSRGFIDTDLLERQVQRAAR
jgi:hypothetical protein